VKFLEQLVAIWQLAELFYREQQWLNRGSHALDYIA
jgi:hypothetical protein